MCDNPCQILSSDFSGTSSVSIDFALDLPLKKNQSCQILQKANKRPYLSLGQQLK